MIQKAKDDGVFDEEEAKRGISITRRTFDEDEGVEMTDEEGNVVAGEKMKLNGQEMEDDFFGPIAQWMMRGCKKNEALAALGLPLDPNETEEKKKDDVKPKKEKKEPEMHLSVHTIALPAQAPKQLLLDLKKVFQTFPGREKVQLKIGEQIVPIPMTVSMTPILERNVEEVLERHKA